MMQIERPEFADARSRDCSLGPFRKEVSVEHVDRAEALIRDIRIVDAAKMLCRGEVRTLLSAFFDSMCAKFDTITADASLQRELDQALERITSLFETVHGSSVPLDDLSDDDSEIYCGAMKLFRDIRDRSVMEESIKNPFTTPEVSRRIANGLRENDARSIYQLAEYFTDLKITELKRCDHPELGSFETLRPLFSMQTLSTGVDVTPSIAEQVRRIEGSRDIDSIIYQRTTDRLASMLAQSDEDSFENALLLARAAHAASVRESFPEKTAYLDFCDTTSRERIEGYNQVSKILGEGALTRVICPLFAGEDDRAFVTAMALIGLAEKRVKAEIIYRA